IDPALADIGQHRVGDPEAGVCEQVRGYVRMLAEVVADSESERDGADYRDQKNCEAAERSTDLAIDLSPLRLLTQFFGLREWSVFACRRFRRVPILIHDSNSDQDASAKSTL